MVEEVKDNISIGHTSNYIKVIINEKLEHNKFFNVYINNIDKNNVYGIIKY